MSFLSGYTQENVVIKSNTFFQKIQNSTDEQNVKIDLCQMAINFTHF